MLELSLAQKICIWILPVLFAITVHEVAHGWVAYKLGDPTAKLLGRITLNPFKHVDFVGTLILPMLLLIFTNFVFGWAKPVPVTWQNLRHPRRDMAWVALAGPLANLLMAVIWAVITQAGFLYALKLGSAGQLLVYMGQAGILINIVLMVLNLLPIPPLDGSRVLTSLLPNRAAARFSLLEPYGFFIILALLATGILKYIISPPIQFIAGLFFAALGVKG